MSDLRLLKCAISPVEVLNVIWRKEFARVKVSASTMEFGTVDVLED